MQSVNNPFASSGLVADDIRVLVVEDHPTNRRVVQMMLEAFGFRLSFAENGLVAAQACARERFDVVLMDLQMPVMDGLTAVRAIRAQEAETGGERMAIAVLSANSGGDYEAAAADAGADTYILKPLTLDSLMNGVSRAVNLARMTAATAPETLVA